MYVWMDMLSPPVRLTWQLFPTDHNSPHKIELLISTSKSLQRRVN